MPQNIQIPNPRPRRLDVRNIPQRCRHDLRVLFQKYGRINRIIFPQHNNTRRGFAVVHFENSSDAAVAQRLLNGQRFAGRQMSVSFRRRKRYLSGYGGRQSSKRGRLRSTRDSPKDQTIRRGHSSHSPHFDNISSDEKSHSRGKRKRADHRVLDQSVSRGHRSYSPDPKGNVKSHSRGKRRRENSPRSKIYSPKDQRVSRGRRSYSPLYGNAANRKENISSYNESHSRVKRRRDDHRVLEEGRHADRPRSTLDDESRSRVTRRRTDHRVLESRHADRRRSTTYSPKDQSVSRGHRSYSPDYGDDPKENVKSRSRGKGRRSNSPRSYSPKDQRVSRGRRSYSPLYGNAANESHTRVKRRRDDHRVLEEGRHADRRRSTLDDESHSRVKRRRTDHIGREGRHADRPRSTSYSPDKKKNARDYDEKSSKKLYDRRRRSRRSSRSSSRSRSKSSSDKSPRRRSSRSSSRSRSKSSSDKSPRRHRK